MELRLCLLLPLALLVGCAGRGSNWPTLAPRAGEVTTMVPRNVAGPESGRCATAADCAPPPAPIPPGAAIDMPPPQAIPDATATQAELAAIAAIIDTASAAAGPARGALASARQAANGSAQDSAAASRVAAAESSVSAALAPLAGAAFRLQALDLATATAPDRATYADRIALLASRIAALQDQ
jgi:hypothetical protein